METQGHSHAMKPPRAQRYLHFRLAPGDEALIDKLPPAQQHALRSEGSYAKRAEQLGVAIGTVRSRLHRAREALCRLREQRGADSRNDSGVH